MLMMLGGWFRKPGPSPADAHDARGLGSENSGQHQLMSYDARWFGSENSGQQQLMLMMLGGLGLKARASSSMLARGLGLKTRASTS